MIARPTALPMMVASASGEFFTRPGKCLVNPRVVPKTSPFGSSMSSPKRQMCGLLRISCSKTEARHCAIVNPPDFF